MNAARVLPRVAWGMIAVAASTVVVTRAVRISEATASESLATRASAGLGLVSPTMAVASGPTAGSSVNPAVVSAATIAVPSASTSDPEPTASAAVPASAVAAAPPVAPASAVRETVNSTVAPTADVPWPGVADPDLLAAVREHIPVTPVVSDPAKFGTPYSAVVDGLLTFRGNPTRSYHGTGPVPVNPQVIWRYPSRPMCGLSTEYQITKSWCGTGWTGQPAIFERGGRTWEVFGAYDYKIHFVDAATGLDIIPPFPTGDIAKGAITVDPDGYPLIYAGSRDNKYRVIAFDRPVPTELWSLEAHAVRPTLWNDDWDAAGLEVNDWLIEGGENSRLHLIKLNRGYGPDGLVTADPTLAWSGEGWDDQELRDVGDVRVSLESSVMLLGDIAYVASSGGLVQGWDVSVMRTGVGEPHRVFRYWTGDDTDATIVGDSEGFIYVGVEVDRNTVRGGEVGQMIKLDPGRPDNPVVWKVDVNFGVDSGTWSTPAIIGDTVIWPTKPGKIYGLDKHTGATRWELKVHGPVLSSPAVVDGVLFQGDGVGVLHAFDLGDGTATPTERWQVPLSVNIESTPAVWKGRLYVGDRSGFMYALGDA